MVKQRISSLPVHEWLAVLAIFLAFSFLIFISQIFQIEDSFSSLDSEAKTVTVTVEGAANHPGCYQFPKGVSLNDVFVEIGGLSRDADVKSLKLKSKIYDDQILVIKTRPKITVYVEGAIFNRGAFVVPKNSNLKKLLNELLPQENADLKALGSLRRKLYNGEVIKIPEKKQ